jgi:phosphatidylserine decarboxylase
MSLQERLLFLKHSRENFHRTGTLTQSSAFLARALSAHASANPAAAALHILEVGVGTGAVTRAIAKQLRPQDLLTAYEINDDFVHWMREKFLTDPTLTPVRHQVNIVHAPIQSVAREPVFDTIVCSLPFSNFPPDLVREIFDIFRVVAKPAATVSFFEYVGVNVLSTAVCKPSERKRIRAVAEIKRTVMRNHLVKTDFVPLNFPPAYVRHLRFT